MIQTEVDKNTMPDGSAPIGDIVPSGIMLPAINGDIQESPLEAPESPEDKGIIRCTSPFLDHADSKVSVA